ncbi:MAG: hypothetical protein ACYS8I_00705 [Planctomycetota bacterium]|jgi:hypothetical protein
MADETTTKRPRRRLKAYHIVLIICCVILACYLLFRHSLKSHVRTKLKDIRAAGYPVTFAELDAWYSIPDLEENAADVITNAFAYYTEWDYEKRKFLPIVGDEKLPPRTEPLADETKSLIAVYLSDNQAALELLHKGARIEHCRYPVDLSRGFDFLLHPLANIKKGVIFLHLEAVLNVENREPELAVHSIESIFGISRSLTKEPLLISQLVNIACKALAVEALERAVNRTEFTDVQLARLSDMLADARNLSTLSRAFVGEQCFAIAAFERPSVLIDYLGLPGRPPGSPARRVVVAFYTLTGLLEKNAVVYLDLMSDCIEAYELPPHQRQKAFRSIEAKVNSLSQIHAFVRQSMSAIPRCVTRELNHIAKLRSAQTALAVQRYRLAEGRLPGALADLVPDYLDTVPLDPFDGNDLRYKKLNVGFVVYSIGEDGKDDGGRERTSGSARSSYDLTFTVER